MKKRWVGVLLLAVVTAGGLTGGLAAWRAMDARGYR
jgi:hypothetical protein